MDARSVSSGPARWGGVLAGENRTLALGAALARAGLSRGTVHLAGELGTGKTTLVRGFLRASGVTGTIRSPTFTLVEEYRIGTTTVGHYDLYRLSEPEELEFLGLRDHLEADSLCFFEWPERGAGVLPVPDLDIRFEYAGGSPGTDARRVRCAAREPAVADLLERVQREAFR